MNHYYPTINIGDIVTRRKLLGLIEHCGVAIAFDTVLHNTPERGEHAVTVADFANGEAIQVRPSGANPSVVSARSQKILANPQRYAPAKRNCQHTVSEVVLGSAASPTATRLMCFVAIAAVAGVLALLRKR